MSPTTPESNRTAYVRDPVKYVERVAAIFGPYKRRALQFLGAGPGARALDVGCGAGDDAMGLQQVLGPHAQITGVDANPDMVKTARARAEAKGLKIEFLEGSAYSLPLPDNRFDACRADRVFQHLERPLDALREMIRVTAPGGLVSIMDVDWGTLVIDSDDPELTARILQAGRAVHVNALAGRQIWSWFKTAGLQDMECYADAVCVTDGELAAGLWGLEAFAAKAVEQGAVTEEQVRGWLESLQRRHQNGTSFSSITGFGVRGRKSL